MAKKIPLTQGRFAIVDDIDFEWASQYKWRFNGRYALRSTSRHEGHRVIQMHREILKAPREFEVDHRNGDRLDNRRSNIRLATTAQNQHNVVKWKTNKSGFKGVSWDTRKQKWHAAVKDHGKTIHLGDYTNPEDAARAYDARARQLHGEFVRPNFQGD